MTDRKDEEHRRDDELNLDTMPDSPFRRLTPAGEPAWHSPPRPDPVDAYTAPPATVAIASESLGDDLPERTDARSGSRFKFMSVLGLVGGVFLLTAIAGGAYIGYRALLGHEDRVTAEYAPADSWAYVAVNVDPTSRAWLDAWELAKRAGIDDELSRIPNEGLAESGSDPSSWDTLIKPAVGRELGFAVWPNPAGADEQPYVAAIVMIADETKAREALAELLDEDAPIEATYRDITYQTNEDDSAAGIVDEALILASTSAAFEEVVDARRDGALDESAGFVEAADRAADDPLIFAYVDGASIADAFATIEDEARDATSGMLFAMPDLGDTFDIYSNLAQITTTVKTDGNALQTEVLTEGRPENFPMMPAGNQFAEQMPASTLFYMASADLYGTVWEPAMAQLEALSGASGSGLGDMPGTGDIDAMLGFDVEDGLLAQLNGPYAMSINVDESGGEYGGQYHFFSEVDDAERVEDTLDDLVANLGGGLPVEPIADGYRLDVAEEDLALELTVADDVLHLSGSYRAVDAGGTLADDAAFQSAMGAMPDNPTVVGYLATDRIWDLLPAEAWEEADASMRDSLEAFGPLVFATAPDGDGTRTLFVMTVE